ncbi:MAG TPA: DciA family protein [Pyrinomonadaceae bacterium]|nr:DciA family protein [Pyrinomonadaceae bacterium]
MEELIKSFPAVMKEVADDDRAYEPLVFAAWRRCIEGPMAEHVVPIRFDEGRVIAAVSNITWQRHLLDLAPALVAKLNGSIGQPIVRFIEFRIDDAAVSLHRAKAKETKRERTDEISREDHLWPELDAAAEEIADPDLRELFRSAAAGTMARRRRMGI